MDTPKVRLEIRRHQLKHWLGKRGEAVCRMAPGGHLAMLTAVSPLFQHPLLGVWSYTCTFPLPKPESQKRKLHV